MSQRGPTRRDVLRAGGGVISGLALAACGAAPVASTATPLPPLEERGPDRATLIRDVEAGVRESYAALSGGYDEAYLDGLAHEKGLILIDVAPEAVQIGYDPRAVQLRQLFPGLSAELVSRRLEVNLSTDATCAWTLDEISVRLLYQGRRLIVPLRASQTLERRNGRWITVLMHVSYALPLAELERALAAPGGLGKLAPLGSSVQRGDAASAVLVLLQSRPWRTASDAVVLGPAVGQEWRGAAAQPAAGPRAFFADAKGSELKEVRLRISATGRVAWGAGLYLVRRESEAKDSQVPVRVSWVFTRAQGGWAVSQVHASTPVPREVLAHYAFGGPIVPPAVDE